MNWGNILKLLINKINLFLLVAFFITAVFVLVQETISKNEYSSYVKNSYSITEGWITTYSYGISSETGSSSDIIYRYNVGVKQYSRKINTITTFPECYSGDSIGVACSKKRFWVIYSTIDPSKSLINLQIDIQEIQDKEALKNLDHFI